MSKKKTIRPSAYEITMMMQREQMPYTSVYNTVKSITSSMYDPSVHVLGYRLYLLSMPVVFNLQYILSMSIFVSGDNKECKNGALNVVDFTIFSSFEKLSHTNRI